MEKTVSDQKVVVAEGMVMVCRAERSCDCLEGSRY